MTNVLDDAERYLVEAGLIDLPGAVLYASAETLKPGPVYLLGLNPGGEGGSTLRDNLAAARRGNNAYLDEEWTSGRPGQSLLQRRVDALCREMGIETRDTPASNLAFTRSTRLATHPGYHGAVQLSAPVHEMFMAAIRPRFLMTFGNLAHFASGVNIDAIESRDAEHAGWRAHRGRATAFGHEVAFGNVPHLSVWPSDRRDEIVRWAIEAL